MAVKSVALLIASILSIIQSVIWISGSITGILVYLCEIEVAPYEEISDFFGVTLIKLYFEGKQCVLNGSYLGLFDLEYRNPDKISLLTPDIVFAVLVAFILLHSLQFYLSISLYISNKKGKEKNILSVVINWSVVTIIISALDAFLSAEFIWDMFKLIDYMKEDYKDRNTKKDDIKGIEYIPLLLGLVSSRLIVFWLWNVCVATSYFLCGACCQKILGVRKEKKAVPLPEPPSPPHYDPVKPGIYTIPSQQPSDVNKVVGRITTFDTHSGLTRRKDWDIYSRKRVTYFNDYSGRLPPVENTKTIRSSVDNKEVVWNPSKRLYHYKDEPVSRGQQQENEREIHVKMDGFKNDGFVSDEPSVFLNEDSDTDFAHRIENFDQGREKVKIEKPPPLGKFVPPPVPPLAPENDSCNC